MGSGSKFIASIIFGLERTLKIYEIPCFVYLDIYLSFLKLVINSYIFLSILLYLSFTNSYRLIL